MMSYDLVIQNLAGQFKEILDTEKDANFGKKKKKKLGGGPRPKRKKKSWN